ncbi:adipocyte plasma membrane-associated protein Hemomucin [Anabrus simplex]|uniref:adipocyte plasma membrane-associated protein Hemomucin n=1 Tax=Anabrus simplex TaxID=316456 RepID=UPI0035A28AE5
MGFLRSVSLRVLEAAVAFLVIVSIPHLPPPMSFTAFSVTPSLPLDGPLALNDKLNNAEHLFEGELKGPEAVVSYNGHLYTGVHGGHILKIEDGELVRVGKFGKDCDGIWEEKLCGRPLGMKFDKGGNLYVADAYYGIFRLNVRTGAAENLISINETIEGRAPKIPNSLDIGRDGEIYWSDSSSEVSLEDGVYALLGDGSGRLFRYDPQTKQSKVLIDQLQFANGVVLSPEEDFVLVAETARSRIHRYYLKGPKQGTNDIFIDGLPGLPDNLKSDGEGGFFVPLVAARDAMQPVVSQILGPYPIVRKFLARLMAMIEMPFHYVNRIYPNYYTKRAAHWIGHFESISMLTPKRVSVLQLDVNGKVKTSFHCLDGSLTGISDVEVFEGAFYFGSPYTAYLGRVKFESPVRKNSMNMKV